MRMRFHFAPHPFRMIKIYANGLISTRASQARRVSGNWKQNVWVLWMNSSDVLRIQLCLRVRASKWMNRDCSEIDVTKLTGEIAIAIEIQNSKVITSSHRRNSICQIKWNKWRINFSAIWTSIVFISFRFSRSLSLFLWNYTEHIRADRIHGPPTETEIHLKVTSRVTTSEWI